MTDADFLNWLRNPASIKCILVEAGVCSDGLETARYMSNMGYITGLNDTPPSTFYNPCVVGGVSVSESLPIDGKASISWGDIEVSNVGGARDTWLTEVWSGRPVKVMLGDVTWPRSDFRVVFSGVTQDISARSGDRLNLLLRDKSQRLNTTLTEATLQNLTLTTDTLKPLCFGEVHNVTPLLIDQGTLTYMVHDGPIEGVIEVRDNGIPVGFGVNAAQGTFSLSASPVGTITASVQGAKVDGVYRNTVGALVKHIAKSYGTDPLTDDDLDLPQLADFDASNPQAVGIYLNARANQLDVMQQLAASVGAQVVLTPAGKLQIKKVSLPASGASVSVTEADVIQDTLQISSTPSVQAAVRLAYCRNYTVQKSLTTGLPANHAELYGEEWLIAQAKNETLADLWKLTTAPEEVNTLLQARSDASAEAARRLSLWGQRRLVLRFDSRGRLVDQPLGGPIEIKHRRFGLRDGKTGQIINKKTDWLTQKVSFDVLI